jgi:membrane protease YdiL (CAAX protease family)
MQTKNRRIIIIVSPILVILIGNFAAQFFTSLLNQWAWIGVFPVYWGSMLLIIKLFGDSKRQKAWFSTPQSSRWWLFLAIFVGLIAFPILLIPNISVMRSIPLVIAWFAFAVINSICEELYWRGFLLDETGHLPRLFSVGYSSLLFIGVHPLVLGVFSRVQAFDPAHPLALLPFICILIVLSVVWCLLYLKTGSLHWSILSHFLTDLGNLSVFLFMNMISF